MSSPKHIALVGCGFTGTSAFYQLVEGYAVKEITIFETSGEFGPGYPYKIDECPDYLINNTTDTMCVTPSNRRAFVEWLRGRPDLVPNLDEKGHLPRAIFGHFLKDVFNSTRTIATIKGIKVNLIPSEVTSIDENTVGRVSIGWDGGQTEADVAILTTGRSPDINPFITPPSGGARYFPSHIMNESFDDLPLDTEVHVMGASLSAYDVLNRLFSPSSGCKFERDKAGVLTFVPNENNRHAVLCSRSGRMKGMQSQHDSNLKRNAFTVDRIRALARVGKLDIPSLRDLLSKDAEDNGIKLDIASLLDPYNDCADANAVNTRTISLLERALDDATDPSRTNFMVDIFGDAQIELWDLFAEQLLSVGDEKFYRSQLETAVLCYAAPCPVPTAEKIIALMRAGRLRIVKGVQNVQLDPDGSYTISHEFGTEIATVLVNTIGSVNRVVTDHRQDALTRDLAEKDLLRPYSRNGVQMLGADVDMASFRANGSQNIFVANMMLWGPGFFTSSAIMMATIVQRLISGLYK